MIKFPFLVGMMLASLAVWMYTRATPGAMSAGQAHAGSAAQKAESAQEAAASADPSLPPSPHNYGEQGSYTNQSVSYGDLGSGTSPNGSPTPTTPTPSFVGTFQNVPTPTPSFVGTFQNVPTPTPSFVGTFQNRPSSAPRTAI